MLTTSTRAIAQALQEAKRRFPNISADGICIAVRGGPFQEIQLDQIATAIEFLAMLEPTKTGRVDSYRLKHAGENWGRRHDLCGYLSNGSVIVAAVALDLVVAPCGPAWSASPNCMIGVSAKSVRRMIAGNDFAKRERGSADRVKMAPIQSPCTI
jgi:hypothetical protein